MTGQVCTSRRSLRPMARCQHVVISRPVEETEPPTPLLETELDGASINPSTPTDKAPRPTRAPKLVPAVAPGVMSAATTTPAKELTCRAGGRRDLPPAAAIGGRRAGRSRSSVRIGAFAPSGASDSGGGAGGCPTGGAVSRMWAARALRRRSTATVITRASGRATSMQSLARIVAPRQVGIVGRHTREGDTSFGSTAPRSLADRDAHAERRAFSERMNPDHPGDLSSKFLRRRARRQRWRDLVMKADRGRHVLVRSC